VKHIIVRNRNYSSCNHGCARIDHLTKSLQFQLFPINLMVFPPFYSWLRLYFADQTRPLSLTCYCNVWLFSDHQSPSIIITVPCTIKPALFVDQTQTCETTRNVVDNVWVGGYYKSVSTSIIIIGHYYMPSSKCMKSYEFLIITQMHLSFRIMLWKQNLWHYCLKNYWLLSIQESSLLGKFWHL